MFNFSGLFTFQGLRKNKRIIWNSFCFSFHSFFNLVLRFFSFEGAYLTGSRH